MLDLADLLERTETIHCAARVHKAFEVFRMGTDILVVLDGEERPLGLMRETDIKKYVYASFGRELIRNKPASDFAIPCETIEEGFDADTLIRRVEAEFTGEGIIVTRQGRYIGMLKKDALLRVYEANRKDNERQILQLQRVESMGTLAGGIAHELNNMLMPIIGNAELGLDDAGEGTRSQVALTRILAAARRASEIVGQILTFCRPDISEKTLVQPAVVFEELTSFIEASLPSTIAIKKDFGTQCGFVLADSTQIHQVLLNLCTNAAHAMNNSGVLHIRVREYRPDAEFLAHHDGARDGDYIALSVRDSGCGIPPEVRERMFEPFYTTKEVGQGTGLGLSVVLGIVRGHGGLITVESEVGRGSEFTVYLPKVGDGKVCHPAKSGEMWRGTGNILYVDDEECILEVVGEYLSMAGFKVITTTSGSHALEMFRADPKRFDLIITDQTMPGMTGVELIGNIRETGKPIPIILCSGNAALTLGGYPLATGADAYLQKPVGMDHLARVVSDTINRAEIRPECYN